MIHSMLFDQSYRNLLRALVFSQFKRRDQGSLLGVFWSVVNPLLTLIILYIIFQNRIGTRVEHYAVYLLTGIVVYTHFANSTSAAMQVFRNMSALAAETVIPKDILVLAAVLSRSIEFAAACFICIVIAALSGVQLTGAVLWIAALVLLQSLFALSVALVLSCLFLYLRDIEHIYQVLLRLLFFLTPIFYDMEFIGDGMVRILILLNPLTHLTLLARGAILGGGAVLSELAICFAMTAVMLGLGLALFRRFEPYIAERV